MTVMLSCFLGCRGHHERTRILFFTFKGGVFFFFFWKTFEPAIGLAGRVGWCLGRSAGFVF